MLQQESIIPLCFRPSPSERKEREREKPKSLACRACERPRELLLLAAVRLLQQQQQLATHTQQQRIGWGTNKYRKEGNNKSAAGRNIQNILNWSERSVVRYCCSPFDKWTKQQQQQLYYTSTMASVRLSRFSRLSSAPRYESCC